MPRSAAMAFSYKLVIVVRADLDLSRGKWCAQAAHAAVMCSEGARKHQRSWFRGWLGEGQKKVVLQAPSLVELQRLQALAERDELPASMVVDYGLTEVQPGTTTCLGIGPAPNGLVDKITGSLSLFR